jgi:hypothetical protein
MGKIKSLLYHDDNLAESHDDFLDDEYFYELFKKKIEEQYQNSFVNLQ